MGGILGSKPPKAPKAKPVSPTPTITSEAEDEALRRAGKKRGGFASQIITGSLVPGGPSGGGLGILR